MRGWRSARVGAVAAGLLVVVACTDRTDPPTTTLPPATAVTTAPTTTTEVAPAAHRIQVRVVEGVGEFYDTVTGEKFVPRGMNYNRFLRSAGGTIQDNVLSTLHYDPAEVDKDFAQIQALGFNVVRIMLETCGPAINGCVTDETGALNAAYFANLADFLERAKAHGLYVMVASNTLPDDGPWIHATAAVQNAQFEGAANEILNPKAFPHYVDYWEQVIRAIIDSGAPLDAIWGYQLRQEQHFRWTEAPFRLDSGMVTTANGRTYDVSDPDKKLELMDEGLVYWADTLRDTIRKHDPTALVTVGFFVPNEPHPVRGTDDPRLVRTAYFIRKSSMDFIDFHHYAGNGVDDNQVWENFGMAGVDDKPIVLGEHGGIRHWFSSEDRAAAAILGLEVASCRVGFDGWLVWGWRGDLSTDIWWANEGKGHIAEVVAPKERPDPCEYADFDFIRYNVAASATATASTKVDDLGPENVIDGTPAHWNAAAVSPQWIRMELSAPADVESIALTIAQDPPGRSVHELWIRQVGGELTLVHTFDGVTSENDVLTYTPTEPLIGVDLVEVVTTEIGDLWPAWHEIEIFSATPVG